MESIKQVNIRSTRGSCGQCSSCCLAKATRVSLQMFNENEVIACLAFACNGSLRDISPNKLSPCQRFCEKFPKAWGVNKVSLVNVEEGKMQKRARTLITNICTRPHD